MSARLETGAASIVAVAGALALCLFALGAADLGSLLVARARAQGAADAAALAAVARQAPILGQEGEPEQAARETAEANGATLLRCDCATGEPAAEVTVEVPARLGYLRAWFGRRARADARAEVDPDVFSYRDES